MNEPCRDHRPTPFIDASGATLNTIEVHDGPMLSYRRAMLYSKRKSLIRWASTLLILGMGWFPSVISANCETRIEPFVAVYDVKSNGLVVGAVTVRLSKQGEGEYELRQTTVSRGLAKLFAPRDLLEKSRWRFSNGAIQPLAYQSQRKEGDAEDNAHLIFDWAELSVRNTGAYPHWKIPLSQGNLDPLLIQLAMQMDLERGLRSFRYSVPRQGRIKTYSFKQVGIETIVLDKGHHQTLKIERTDDARDRTWIWSAPELGFFAVRIVKQRKRAVDTELLLRSLEFGGTPARL